MSVERFIALWMNPNYPPRPVEEAGLREVERHFGFAFPEDYRAAVLAHGLLSPTIALLDVIVDGEIDMADLNHMLAPDRIVASTEDWREMGLPPDKVAFATDCSGNLFCFDTAASDQVFLFDHDFGTIRPVAATFASWIDAFCSLPPPQGEE